MKNSNFDNLEFSGVGHRLILSDLYYVIDDYCKGFENLVASLPSYKPSDIIDWLENKCLVYVAFTNEVKSIWIFQYVNSTMALMHICTFDSTYNWHKFFEQKVRPKVAKKIETIVGLLDADKVALVRLYKRYGYEPVFDDNMQKWKYLVKLP